MIRFESTFIVSLFEHQRADREYTSCTILSCLWLSEWLLLLLLLLPYNTPFASDLQGHPTNMVNAGGGGSGTTQCCCTGAVNVIMLYSLSKWLLPVFQRGWNSSRGWGKLVWVNQVNLIPHDNWHCNALYKKCFVKLKTPLLHNLLDKNQSKAFTLE